MPPLEARQRMTRERSGLENRQFHVGEQTDSRVVYVRDYWPGWVIVLCILLFPLGLLALLTGRKTERITFEFEPERDGSLVRVFGTADKNTCRVIEAL